MVELTATSPIARDGMYAHRNKTQAYPTTYSLVSWLTGSSAIDEPTNRYLETWCFAPY